MSESKKSLLERTRSFFGVDSNYSQNEVEAWNQRRLKFCSNKFGDLDYEKIKSESDQCASVLSGDRGSVVSDKTVHLIQQPSSSIRRQFSSLAAQGWLQPSLITPQVSVCPDEAVTKKRHAFRAIASVVRASIRRQRSLSNELPRLVAQASSEHADTVDGRGDIQMDIIEPVIQQECQVMFQASNQRPEFKRQPSRLSRSLKWTHSKIERARNGIQQLNVKRRFNDSLMGRVLCCADSTSRKDNSQGYINSQSNYRPYFTYWVSFVQIIVFICGLSVYGYAPITLNAVSHDYADVAMLSGSIQRACRHDYANPLLGPRKSDLIKLGARYSPCMRQDLNLEDQILRAQRKWDNQSGCCLRNDGNGCFQSNNEDCSPTLAIWINETVRKGHSKSKTNVVCGLDPDWCLDPISQPPYEWPDAVTEWPICRKQNSSSTKVINKGKTFGPHNQHMKCELTGRPCCIGSKAECIITTRQHCEFLRGNYHPEANLCSQVQCLAETCGMLPFFINPNRGKPDQFYRFITALFVIPSLGSLIITLIFQLTIQRDLEKMAGWHRISIVYLLSGIIGNLCSGIFLPFQVQCGPSGSIFGMLAMTFTEFLQSWPMVARPWPVFIRFTGLGIFLLILGLLPFFDNYAQVSGFISGILLSFIFLPFLGMPNYRAFEKLIASNMDANIATKKFEMEVRTKRLIIIGICTLLWLSIFIMFIMIFYLYPVTTCTWCKYLNCIPITEDFCDNMDVNITERTPCVKSI